MMLLKALPIFLASLAPLPAQGPAGVRVLLGLTDTTETKWDGSASARGAKIVSLEPWLFEGSDALAENSSWRVSTHQIRLFGGQIQAPRPVVANGVIVWMDRAADDVEPGFVLRSCRFDSLMAEVIGKVIFDHLGADDDH